MCRTQTEQKLGRSVPSWPEPAQTRLTCGLWTQVKNFQFCSCSSARSFRLSAACNWLVVVLVRVAQPGAWQTLSRYQVGLIGVCTAYYHVTVGQQPSPTSLLVSSNVVSDCSRCMWQQHKPSSLQLVLFSKMAISLVALSFPSRYFPPAPKRCVVQPIRLQYRSASSPSIATPS